MVRRRRGAGGIFLAWMALVGVVAIGASCAGTPACRFNSDCNDAYCSDGVCKQDCINASIDCAPGYICNEVAQCEAPVGDGGVPGTDGASSPDGGHGGDASPSKDGTVAPDGPQDSGHDVGTADVGSQPDAVSHPDVTSPPDVAPPPDGGGPLGTTLDLCTGDAMCASGLLCRAFYVGGPTRCTPACADTSTCPTGERCVTFGAEEYCVLSDVGRSCTASSSCSFGCLTGPEYCTMPCASGSDCPNGYGCEAVGTPSVSVCVKAEAPCDATDTSQCIAAAACDTSSTLVVAGCTLACDTASDCPQRAEGFQPWTCDGLCRRPPDVYGPLQQGATPAQYACDADGVVVNVCNDAQHIDFTAFTIPSPPVVSCAATMTTNGVNGDACVDSCVYQGSCAFGYACTALGSVGSDRVGLCLPSLGGAEVGGSCTTDGDCAFGYCNRTAGTCSRDCTADGLCTTGFTCVASGTVPVEGVPWRRCQ